jgi:two-component system, chemotaxis family, chemotaxis protein CheY
MSVESPVLVVEDDQELRDVIEWALADAGYPVTAAENGAVALRAIEHRAPGAILLDMRMPVMDGWMFAQSYRDLPGPHAPIIVLTAARDAAEWAEQIRAADYLAKPFELDELLRTLKRHMA